MTNTTAAPLSAEQLDRIARSYFAEEYAQQHVKNAIHDAFLEAGLIAQARSAAPAELPAILFDGHAVYHEITRHLGKEHCYSPDAVSTTLDAVVRLMRAERAAPAGQADEQANDQWIFDLAAEHEANRSGLYGPVTFDAMGLADFAHAIEAEVVRRCRAQGGETSNNSSIAAPVAGQQAAPAELSKAFMTLESSGGEGRTIVLKFNQRTDAYAVHDFLLKAGSKDYRAAASQAAPAQQAGEADTTASAGGECATCFGTGDFIKTRRSGVIERSICAACNGTGRAAQPVQSYAPVAAQQAAAVAAPSDRITAKQEAMASGLCKAEAVTQLCVDCCNAGEDGCAAIDAPTAAAATTSEDARDAARVLEYRPGSWFEAQNLDEMQAFYLSRLPAIREAAKAHGYAIGVHGSQRRDFDLMAMQWRDDASDKDTLAHAIAVAACGLTRDGTYAWEAKPNGRFAVSIPICWTDHENPEFGNKPSLGHIDLSVIDTTWMIRFIDKRAEDYLRDHASTDPDTGAVEFHFGEAGREYHSTLEELADELRAAMRATQQEGGNV